MTIKKFLFAIFVFSLILSAVVPGGTIPKFGGVRASRVMNSYPNSQFPKAAYWVQASQWMAGKYSGAGAAAIWIVSLAGGDGEIYTNFPADGKSYPNVYFGSVDNNEAFLNAFDTTGVRVWLQVESGSVNVDTLIELVMARYKRHRCVAGFGIDVEWLDWKTNAEGRKLSDSLELKRWEEHVRKFDTTYTMFVKHYSPSWMPSVYRGRLLFVDDSQQFTSFSDMLYYFKQWGNKFTPSNVAFQFGYPDDSPWWKQYADPAGYIGNQLFTQIPNAVGMVWVDFTLTKVFPIMSALQWNGSDVPKIFTVSPAYPNPCNPSTTIRFTVGQESHIMVTISDATGRVVETLANETLSAGVYQTRWNAEGMASGMYFCTVRCGNAVEARKIVLMK